MTLEQATLPFQDKGKAPNCPPSHTNISTTTLPSLSQLKNSIENSPGIIKNASDAHEHLEKKQWLLCKHKNTNTQLATILFSLLATTGT
jgi:hypothetical protein